MAFAEVFRTLSPDQLAAMTRLPNSATDETGHAFIYSQRGNLRKLPKTNPLFTILE